MDTRPQLLALVVGIDRYEHLAPQDHLRGAVRDAEAMASLLEGRFEFPAANIRLLLDQEATSAAVLTAFDELQERADENTVVVLHWSGHGSQRLSRASAMDRGAEPHGLDETLITYDARGGGIADLADKDLLVHLGRLGTRGARITWIADSCHSGHLYRDPRFGRARFVERIAGCQPTTTAETEVPITRHPRLGEQLNLTNQQVLLAACQADQQALERPLLEEDAHGEWTYALLSVLKDSPEASTARQIFDEASARLLSAGVPQLPRLVGARDRLIFGVEARPAVRYIEVRKPSGSRIELTGGGPQGLTEGSLWGVFPAGTYEPEPFQSPQRIKLTRVGALSSQAEVEVNDSTESTSRREIQAGDWAFEIAPSYGDQRLGVRLMGWNGAARVEIENLVGQSAVLRCCQESSVAGAFLERSDGRIRIFDARGIQLISDLPMAEPSSLGMALERLERKAKARHSLRLRNRDPDSRVAASLKVELLRQDASGSWETAKRSDDQVPEEGRGPDLAPGLLPRYRCGDSIALDFSHSFERELFVYVLNIGLNDEVAQLFPPPGGVECVPPGLQICPGDIDRGDFELWAPKDLCSGLGGVGFFKIFATTEPSSLDWLDTKSRWPRGFRASGGSLQRLLYMGTSDPVFRHADEDWGTAVCPFWLDTSE